MTTRIPRVTGLPAVRVSPQLVLAVFVLLLALPQNNVVAGVGASITPARLLAGCAALWWLVTRVSGGFGLRTGRNPVRTVLLGTLATFALANAVALVGGVPEEMIPLGDRATLLVVLYFGTALLTCDAVEGARGLRMVSGAMVLAATLSAGAAAGQFAGVDLRAFTVLPGLMTQGLGDADLARGGLTRALGFANHPIELAAVSALCLPLALYLARHGRWRLLWWGCGAVLVVGTLVSISRTGLLGMAIVGVLLLWRIGVANWLITLFGTVLLVVLFGMIEPRLVGVLDKTVTGSGQDSSVHARLDDYEYVYERLVKAPLTGQGYGTYQAPPQPFLDNQYLLTTVESGLIGLGALLVLLLVPTALMSRVWRGRGVIPARRHETTEVRDAAWALGCGLLICAASFATFDAMAFPQFQGFTFLLIGLAGALAAQTLPGRAVGARVAPDEDAVGRAGPGVAAERAE